MPNILALKPPPSDSVPTLIIEATRHFASHLAKLSISSKHSMKQTNTTTKLKVAICESFYHCELYAVLRSWVTTGNGTTSLYTGVTASSHDPTKGDGKLDLLLICNDTKYCIELMATGDDSEINRHFENITKYTMNINPRESWLIHYTMSPSEDLWKRRYNGHPKVKQLNIRHDMEWINFTYWYTGLHGDVSFTLQTEEEVK